MSAPRPRTGISKAKEIVKKAIEEYGEQFQGRDEYWVLTCVIKFFLIVIFIDLLGFSKGFHAPRKTSAVRESHATMRVYRADGETIGAVEWGSAKRARAERPDGKHYTFIKTVSDWWAYSEDTMRVLRTKPRTIATFFDPHNPSYLRV